MEPLKPNKAFYTTNLSSDEAELWIDDLLEHTLDQVRLEYPFYLRKKLYPIKAFKIARGQQNPKFIVNHHTNGVKTAPAFARFCTSTKASAHFICERNGNIMFMVDPDDLAYHAGVRSVIPLSIKRALSIENGWVNEVGIETVGKGNVFLFRPEQFENLIVLQRNLNAKFGKTIVELKSHRFFSPIERSGDPGPFYLLPLVQHAVLTDISLDDPNYWLAQYKKDPIDFMNNKSKQFIKSTGITDEWEKNRNKLVTIEHIMPGEEKHFESKN